jgi:hypothetical protein
MEKASTGDVAETSVINANGECLSQYCGVYI